MTSSFLMLVISLISLWEDKDQVSWGSSSLPPELRVRPGNTGHAMHPQGGGARLT